MIPVDPGAGEARDWLARELAKPAYREAEPSWFDTLVSRVLQWLGDLTSSGAGGPPVLVLIVVVVLLAGLIVAAYYIFGPPRLNRRSATSAVIFGADDSRDAATIRRAAEQAASAGDWAVAIEEMFRAIARGLSERAVLETSPGTTASGFATRAAQYFPASEGGLVASAADFDDVRYLGRPGTRDAYTRVAVLESALRERRPALDPVTP